MVEIVSFIFALLCLAGFAGFLSGLLGVGGGTVLVPGLYFIFSYFQSDIGFEAAYIMHCAVATSLAVIVPTSVSSTRAHHKRGHVEFGIVRQIGIGIVFGVLVATILAQELAANSMQLIFAGAIFVLAWMMMLDPARLNTKDHNHGPFLKAIAGIVMGLVSTLIGIGAATMSVPYMRYLGVKMHHAVGSGSLLGVVVSIPAALGYTMIGLGLEGLPPFSMGYVNLLAWILIVPVSVTVAPLGAKVSSLIRAELLRRVFACYMVLVSLMMMYEAYF